MKKFMYLLVATAIFVGCAKKEDDPSDPNESNGGNNSTLTELIISNVENAPATSVIDEVVLESDFGVLASAPWNGSTAKIILPTTVRETDPASVMFEGLTVSDGNARVVRACVVGRKSGTILTRYWFYSSDRIGQGTDRQNIIYIYTDRELTVKGKRQDRTSSGSNYDLLLKKGWNKVLIGFDNSYTTTSSDSKWTWTLR